MTGAGDLRECIEFQQRGMEDDGFGNVTPSGPYATVFTAAARRVILKGGETVMASRLTGVQTVVFTIRYQQAAIDAVDNTWQLRDARKGTLYNVKSVEPDPAYAWVTILAEKGSLA